VKEEEKETESCQEKFGFMLPSIQLDKRRKKFKEKYIRTLVICTYLVISAVWPMFAILVLFLLFARIFACENLRNVYSNLMIIV